ncbi:type IV pilus secretin family protein [Methylomonas koyamae]|uniref:Pilus assembly protein PilQ n=1 Tax=Methylomonas koyamae TaxID=702114 RepID=A0A291IPN4_9GAMM|nr:type IV pilus secretin family protein [Methylomonas koyamae]ATG92178.1 pilus assembly protein PilQ [Methylomonas koyamae]OAI25677.1 pilus assembly protein PilQ [Methylomonas koyamae]
MSIELNSNVRIGLGRLASQQCLLFLVLWLAGLSVRAEDAAINNLEFSSLAGNQVQIQLETSGGLVEPKIFQTDNPSRIALDFAGVKSNLAKKSFPINQGAAGTVYVVEASGRTRVIINLVEKVPYETRVEGDKYYVILKSAGTVSAVNSTVQQAPSAVKNSAISKFLPEQNIKSIDFRRGPNGEGRLLLGLSAANTVVDTKQSGGKVVLNFLNTRLPESLVKNFDVSDFATPVQRIEAVPKGDSVNITITPSNGNYDYSSYQADNLLTVEFRPLTPAEKEAQQKEKFPYVGNKLSLNFQDIEVRSVLQILADFTELNIIAADSVAGNVTLRLNDVPWDQALELILKAKGLAKRQNGNVVMVAPVAEIMKIEQEELDSKKIFEELEPLKTENIQINYAKASEICGVLMGIGNNSQGGQSGAGGSGGGAGGCGGGATSSPSGLGVGGQAGALGGAASMRLLSPRGTAIVDARTNTLIVKDTAKAMEDVRKMIKLLDVPVRQVLIESRIVIADTSFAQNLGTKFGVAHKTDVNGGTQYGMTGAGVDTSENSQILADLGSALAASSGGALALTLARGADYLLNLEINALQDDGKGELVSNPRVMTSDRVQASIKQGVQIPYQTQSQATGPVTQLVDAVLELNVTPQITPSGSVIMQLDIKKDSPGTPLATGGNATVPIDTRQLKTKVQVEDGETVVLGGIYESTVQDSYNTVPWVSDLPVIGWMFKKSIKTDNKKELLVFITPKIVKESLSAK